MSELRKPRAIEAGNRAEAAIARELSETREELHRVRRAVEAEAREANTQLKVQIFALVAFGVPMMWMLHNPIYALVGVLLMGFCVLGTALYNVDWKPDAVPRSHPDHPDFYKVVGGREAVPGWVVGVSLVVGCVVLAVVYPLTVAAHAG